MAIRQEDTLYPIAVLVDELKHDEVALRLNAVHRLSTIAIALGPERTREELVPFLTDESTDDEDEVLHALAEEIGKFAEYVGGPAHIPVLLPSLQSLAAQEETVVRDKAVESLCVLCGLMLDEQVATHFVPLIEKLATGEFFTSRTSSTGLFAAAYPRIDAASQERLRTLYAALCKDDTPMTRRAAATNLTKFVRVLSKEHVQKEATALFALLAADEHDSVRVLAVPPGAAIATLLTPAESAQLLMPTVRLLASDKSWRVRYMVADNFVELATALGEQITKDELTNAFVNLLRDNEAEVRTAAASKVPGLCKLITEEMVIRSILPCVKDLVADSSQHVRAALAQQISGLAPILGQQTTTESLLPLFLQLLRDEFSEVRLNVISKLDLVNEVIGIDLLSQSLLPAIVELAEDKQWRVRLAIIEYIPLLARQLGVAFFDDKLSNLCLSWLGDCVFSIREAATVNLRKLTDVFGVEWAQTTILPKVLSLCTHPNYLYRMTTIYAINILSEVVPPKVIVDSMLPVVTGLWSDVTPNIRFNVAKTFERLIPLLVKDYKPVVVGDIKATLEKLTKDSDMDVQFFARQALAVIPA